MRAEARAKNAPASAPIRRGNSRLTVTHVPGLICYLCPRPFNLYFTRIFVEAARLVGDFAFEVVGAQSSITEQ